MRMPMIMAVLFVLLGGQAAFGYDVVDRYKLLSDKFQTERMLRPIGHDFFLDLTPALNTNLLDVIDDAEAAADTAGGTTAKVAAAQDFLNKYNNTEQTIDVNVGLGFPLPSFSPAGIKIKPNFRAFYNLGANIGIRSSTLDVNTILDLISVDLDDTLETAIRNNFGNLSTGDDIITSSCTNAGISISECTTLAGQFFFPDTTVPNLFTTAKQDVRAGLYIDYQYDENWFGHLNAYALHRTDIFTRITEQALARDSDILDLGDELNSEIYFELDYRLGYTDELGLMEGSAFAVFASIEELKLLTLTDRDAGSKAPVYGTDPLLRLHGEALFNLAVFSLKPFLGIHKRTGYDLGDGIYGGADAGIGFWEDRLLAQFRVMVDPEHLTLSPKLKLWFAQLEYSLKSPLSSTKDGINVSTLHSLNFRLFF